MYDPNEQRTITYSFRVNRYELDLLHKLVKKHPYYDTSSQVMRKWIITQAHKQGIVE